MDNISTRDSNPAVQITGVDTYDKGHDYSAANVGYKPAYRQLGT